MPALDHVVFNTRDQTDRIVALFEAMGFFVTPRGVHTLGSINHTIVFDTSYLELLGYLPGSPPPLRPELARHPAGLMATVLRTTDAEATHRQLVQAGLVPRAVQSFSRPVSLDDGSIADAAFRVTRLEPDVVPGTWFYFCQHLTPQLVWRPQWQHHPVGGFRILGLESAVPDPQGAANLYRTCIGLPASKGDSDDMADDSGTVFLHAEGWTMRLRPGATGMRGITIAVPSFAPLRQRLEAASIPFLANAGAIEVPHFAGTDCRLQFIVQAR
jgi:hypothetical protein